MNLKSFVFVSRSSGCISEHNNVSNRKIAILNFMDLKIMNAQLFMISAQGQLQQIFSTLMRLLTRTVAICGMIIASYCNIWDNIFSETEASSPIILTESLNVKFPMEYQDIDFDITLDFNKELDIITLIAEKNVLIINLEAIRLQIDLKELILTTKSMIKDCENFKLVLDTTDLGQLRKLNLREKAFLINILFQYVGRNKRDRTMSQYVLMPDLIIQHTEDHEEYQKNPLLVVDKNGAIVQAYEDKDKKKKANFSFKSKVSKKLKCPGQIREVTKQQIYETVKKSIQNKDYEKIPGLPKMPNFDISKLPIPKL